MKPLVGTNLKYPDDLINSTIAHFVASVLSLDPNRLLKIKTMLESYYHSQIKHRSMQRQNNYIISDLSNKINNTLQLVFTNPGNFVKTF